MHIPSGFPDFLSNLGKTFRGSCGPEEKGKKSKTLTRSLFLFIVTARAEVAQSVEQRPEKPRVGSSILPLGTNIKTFPNPSKSHVWPTQIRSGLPFFFASRKNSKKRNQKEHPQGYCFLSNPEKILSSKKTSLFSFQKNTSSRGNLFDRTRSKQPETEKTLVLPGIAWGKKDATEIEPESGGVEI